MRIFRTNSHSLFIGLTIDADDSGIIIYFRALQGHSERSLIDPSLQDNVVIPSGFFQYIYHIGCGFNLHSIINSGLILGGQNSTSIFRSGKD